MITIIASISSIITAIIALLAVFIAYQQLEANKKQTAHTLYNEYLKLCFENPDLAAGLSKPPVRCQQYNKYCWFLSQAMFTFEQILLAVNNEKQWRVTIEDQLQKHKAHLKISSAATKDEWEPQFSELIKKVVNS